MLYARCITVVLFLVASVLGASAQTLQARAGDSLVWDQIQTDTVTRFEVSVDSGSFTSIGLPTTSNDANTTAGYNSYAWVIPVNTTVGTHAYSVRACNSLECGAAGSVSVQIVRTPSAPSRFRIRPVVALNLLPPGE